MAGITTEEEGAVVHPTHGPAAHALPALSDPAAGGPPRRTPSTCRRGHQGVAACASTHVFAETRGGERCAKKPIYFNGKVVGHVRVALRHQEHTRPVFPQCCQCFGQRGPLVERRAAADAVVGVNGDQLGTVPRAPVHQGSPLRLGAKVHQQPAFKQFGGGGRRIAAGRSTKRRARELLLTPLNRVAHEIGAKPTTNRTTTHQARLFHSHPVDRAAPSPHHIR
jgi:hypothetical protein